MKFVQMYRSAELQKYSFSSGRLGGRVPALEC